MVISDRGLNLIKTCEGFRSHAYPDPGTGGAPWTCGYGHTGKDVTPTTVCTDAQATEWLRNDVAAAEHTVNNNVEYDLSQNQFDALVSFVYNCGPANFLKSTLLKKLNAGDFDGAANEFGKWNKAAGRELPGLTKRRAAEAAMFRGA